MRKRLVYLILLLSFLAVFLFNLFTPMLSDDFDYARQARSAQNLLQLFQQEYHQYMTWNGRSVTFMLYRIFLCAPEAVLKLANSLVFLLLSVLIYMNIEGKKKWDVFTMLLVQLGLWFFAVDFPQTILWECGAFVYLWGMTIILMFMTIVRCRLQAFQMQKDLISGGILPAVLLFLLGWAAGWCNENTSGGCLLGLLIVLGYRIYKKKKSPLFLYTAIAGNIVGLGFLVLGPGVRLRAAASSDDNYSGLLGIAARVQKLTLYNRQAFLFLLIVFGASVLWTLLSMKENKEDMSFGSLVYRLRYRLLFFLLYGATLYALAATRLPQIRALFGAGIFLLIACIQGIRDNLSKDHPVLMLRYVYGCVVLAMTCMLFFTMVDSLIDLQRIRRDYNERIAYIEEQIANGQTEIVVAKFHTDFANDYTCAYEMELSDDPAFWTNVQYEQYFGVTSISAIPYDEWEEKYGGSAE